MLLYEKAGNIGILTINRPEALNALNSALLDCLYEKVTEIAHDTELRCLIVTGAGKAFVAGADISEMKDLSRPEAFAFGMHGHKAFCALENLAVPVIAAVNGYALGGGCELSLCADIRIASEKAKFGQPEVGLGIIPGFGGTQRLTRTVNRAYAADLILSARTVSAGGSSSNGACEPSCSPRGADERSNEACRNDRCKRTHCRSCRKEGNAHSLHEFA